MANLQRYTQKIFGSASNELGQFGSAIAGTKVTSSDVETLQSLQAYLDGWSKAVVTNKNYPTWQEMDGVLYGITYQQAYMFQNGIPEYDDGTEYKQTSIVKESGTYKLYGSLIDNNIGNPLTDTNSWQFLIDLSDLQISQYTKFAINKGDSDLLNAPGSGTVIQEQIDWVPLVGSGVSYDGSGNPTFSTNSASISNTTMFDTPKLCNYFTGHLYTYTALGYTASGLTIYAIDENDNSIAMASISQVRGGTEHKDFRYDFSVPTLIKGVSCVASGDVSGFTNLTNFMVDELITISISTADTLYFNVSSNNLLTYTNIMGETKTVDILSPIDVSGENNGTYKVALPKTGNQPYLFDSNVFIQEDEPTTQVQDDLWINPQEPYSAKQFDGTNWQDYNDVLLLDSSVTVGSGVITDLEQPKYNSNHIEPKFQNNPQIIETYINGTSGYFIRSDGYCEQWGYANLTTVTTITFLKEFKDTNYNGSVTEAGTSSLGSAQSNCRFGPVSGSQAIVTSGLSSAWAVYWRVCGYIN